jgi:hypothetical protein
MKSFSFTLDENVVEACPLVVALDNHFVVAAQHSSGKQWPAAVRWACNQDASGRSVECPDDLAGVEGAVELVPRATQRYSGRRHHFRFHRQVPVHLSKPSTAVSNSSCHRQPRTYLNQILTLCLRHKRLEFRGCKCVNQAGLRHNEEKNLSAG